jgi:hypothetical protein
MAPCTYINEEVTADMRSILAIKVSFLVDVEI